jgi:hypothetical protein
MSLQRVYQGLTIQINKFLGSILGKAAGDQTL